MSNTIRFSWSRMLCPKSSKPTKSKIIKKKIKPLSSGNKKSKSEYTKIFLE